MNIILDSNIFRGDFLLRSKDLEIVSDYLAKTNSSIILPQIILDEIKGLYLRTLTERIAAYKGAIGSLNLTVTSTEKHIKAESFNVEEETKNYEAFVLNQLNISKDEILPYQNEYLPEIAQRAISRKKPAGEDGQGFRDTLIWLTIKNYCAKIREKEIVFIGNNSNDFSNAERDALHPTLSEECNREGIKINYYKSVKEFIEKHSVKVAFLNDNWIIDNVDFEFAEDLIKIEINKKSTTVLSTISRYTQKECTGNFSITSVQFDNFHDPFVYEMLEDNKLIVNVIVHFVAEIEFDYYEGPYAVQVSADIWEPEYRGGSSRILIHPSAFLTLTVIDKKVTNYEIDDCVLD